MVSDFMKEMYNLMIYIGIDIAKLKHFASAISPDGEILMMSFKFTNDGNSFSLLLSNLASLFDDKDSIIGRESTAHYENNLIRYLNSLVSVIIAIPGIGYINDGIIPSTMPMGTVLENSLESFGKCSPTKSNLTSTKRSVYLSADFENPL